MTMEKERIILDMPPDLLAGKQVGVQVSHPCQLSHMPGKPDFLVVGEEFCERLLPDWEEIEAIFESGEAPVRSILTPPVTNYGLKRLGELLDRLAQRQPETEVTVNDWGVDHLLTESSYPFPKVFGRLMNKQRKDARCPPAASHVESDLFQAFLIGRGYKRIEWDPRWPAGNGRKPGLPGTLHWPEVVLTWTRSCLTANLAADPGGQSALGVISCQKSCREYDITINKRGFPVKLTLCGHALFYEARVLPPDINGKGIDRIVLNAKRLSWK